MQIVDLSEDGDPYSSFAASILILILGGPLLYLLYQWLSSTEDPWDVTLLYFVFIIIGGFLLLIISFWCLTCCLHFETKWKAKKDGTYVKRPKEVEYWSRYHGYIKRPEKPRKTKSVPNIMSGNNVSIRVPGTRSTSVMPSPPSVPSITPNGVLENGPTPSMNLSTNAPPPLDLKKIPNGPMVPNGNPYHLTVSENYISMIDIV